MSDANGPPSTITPLLQGDTQTILIIINLVFTFITTVLASIKFRAKCGNNFFSCKPKDATSSPGSVASNDTPRYKPPNATELPRDAIAVIVDDTAVTTP